MTRQSKPDRPSKEGKSLPQVSPNSEVPFIRRDRELEFVDRCLESTRAGKGTLMLIEGTTGIGKSALMRSIQSRASASGLECAVSQCYERGLSAPHDLWRDLFSQLASVRKESAALLPEPLGGSQPVSSAYQLAERAASFLNAASAQQPVVILVDDLHWADSDTLDILDHVTRKVQRNAILLVAAYCVEEIRNTPLSRLMPTIQRDRGLTKITLSPLNESAIPQLSEILGFPLSQELAARLYRRSGGIPLYLVELLKEADRYLEEDEEVGSVPPLLEQLFTRRIEGLGSDVSEFLEVSAVAGETWRLAVVEATLRWPEDRLVRALDAALLARLVEDLANDDEGYRFAHGLIRETLYTRLISRHRRNLHGRIAAVLETEVIAHPSYIGDVAYHFYAAADWPRAFQYSVRAGDTAKCTFAHRAAVRFYQQAARAVGQNPVSADPAACVSLFRSKGDAHMTLNQKEEAEESFSLMLESARTARDIVSECRALCALTRIQEWRYRFTEAHHNARLALELADRCGDLSARVAAHLTCAHLCLVSGTYPDASDHVEVVASLAVGDGFRRERGRGTLLASYLSAYRGDYAAAHRHATQAYDLARYGEDYLTIGGASFSLGLSLGELARYTSARDVIQSGLDTIEVSGDVHYRPKLQNLMGWLHNQVGDYEAALDWNERALEESRLTGAGSVLEAECYTLLNLASDELCLGRIVRAERRVGEFEAVLPQANYNRPRYFSRYLLLLGELALADDEPETALTRAREASRFAITHDFRKNTARAELLAGRAQMRLGTPDATVFLHRAREIADEIAHPALRWQTRLYLHQAMTALGDPELGLVGEAGRQLDAILTEIDDFQWRTCLEATEPVRELRATPSTDRKGPLPAGLTRRETEVLGLVAEGATNQTIADKLFVSVKTINTHVENILRKTRSDNRAAAATFAARHGIIRSRT